MHLRSDSFHTTSGFTLEDQTAAVSKFGLFTVLIVEVLNTSIEVLTDRIGLDRHELSGLAKDLGSLAVTLSLLLWAIVWGVIVPQYWSFGI